MGVWLGRVHIEDVVEPVVVEFTYSGVGTRVRSMLSLKSWHSALQRLITHSKISTYPVHVLDLQAEKEVRKYTAPGYVTVRNDKRTACYERG